MSDLFSIYQENLAIIFNKINKLMSNLMIKKKKNPLSNKVDKQMMMKMNKMTRNTMQLLKNTKKMFLNKLLISFLTEMNIHGTIIKHKFS